MRVLIISDSHDNIVRLNHIIGFGEASNAGAIIHCGDWNTPLSVKQFNFVKIPVYGVLGNADIDPEMKVKTLASVQRSGQNSKVKISDDFLEIELDNRKILVCHFPARLEELVKKGNYDIGFSGHTHKRRKWKYNSTPLVNPGALHRTSEPSFAVYDTKSNEVEILDIAI